MDLSPGQGTVLCLGEECSDYSKFNDKSRKNRHEKLTGHRTVPLSCVLYWHFCLFCRGRCPHRPELRRGGRYAQPQSYNFGGSCNEPMWASALTHCNRHGAMMEVRAGACGNTHATGAYKRDGRPVPYGDGRRRREGELCSPLFFSVMYKKFSKKL